VYVLRSWIEALRMAGVHGSAVLVSSVVARIGVANHEAIAAAKGGIEALARSAAATYAPIGLRINVVAPGMTETPMTEGMLRADPMRAGAARQYPLGGIQTSAQVADAIVWLLSDGAARITGQSIAVDGGFTSIRPLVK
jgi:NAD(P)-dependent dehydrogenase (short-subunit alcohol dehydrogenase family)